MAATADEISRPSYMHVHRLIYMIITIIVITFIIIPDAYSHLFISDYDIVVAAACYRNRAP